MSLKDILKQFSGGDHATIERLAAKVSALTAELKTAEKAARKKYLENSKRGGSGLPADRAEKAVAEARRRLERAQGALIEARERKVGLEQAQAAQAERKRQKAIKASLIRLHEAGVVVDQKIDELAEALRVALDEARVLGGLTTDSTTRAQLARAFAAVDYCVSSKLLFLKGQTDSTATAERTKFSTYLRGLPELSIGQNGNATTAPPEPEAVA